MLDRANHAVYSQVSIDWWRWEMIYILAALVGINVFLGAWQMSAGRTAQGAFSFSVASFVMALELMK